MRIQSAPPVIYYLPSYGLVYIICIATYLHNFIQYAYSYAYVVYYVYTIVFR